jgi:hypothetical protein
VTPDNLARLVTVRDIATERGLPTGKVRRILRAHGVDPEVPGSTRTFPTTAALYDRGDVEAAFDAYEAGAERRAVHAESRRRWAEEWALKSSRVRPNDPDVATDCDICRAPILYGATCYQVPTGETWTGGDGDPDDGLPVVRIVCGPCYAEGKR